MRDGITTEPQETDRDRGRRSLMPPTMIIIGGGFRSRRARGRPELASRSRSNQPDDRMPARRRAAIVRVHTTAMNTLRSITAASVNGSCGGAAMDGMRAED